MNDTISKELQNIRTLVLEVKEGMRLNKLQRRERNEYDEKLGGVVKLVEDIAKAISLVQPVAHDKEDGELTEKKFTEMMVGIAKFCKCHDWEWRFGDEKEREMKPGNFGTVELQLPCGCAVILGFLPDRTYHLHSMELREENLKETLFEV